MRCCAHCNVAANWQLSFIHHFPFQSIEIGTLQTGKHLVCIETEDIAHYVDVSKEAITWSSTRMQCISHTCDQLMWKKTDAAPDNKSENKSIHVQFDKIIAVKTNKEMSCGENFEQ